MVNVKKDLTGKIFGRLLVLEQAEDYVSPDNRHHCQWLCECNCKNKTKIIVRGSQLHSKRTLSCGCLKNENTSKSNKIKKKKYNKYNLSGEYGIGYTFKGEEFYFDLEDYDLIKNYCWHISNGYVTAKKESGSNKEIQMHRIILNISDISYKEIIVDHIHGKSTRNDNRKSNIRIANYSQNNMNKDLRKNNTSGITGIVWNEKNQKWQARIRINNKDIHLGYFNKNNLEEAILARKKAEDKYFGEFSFNNSQNCQSK